MGIDPGTTVMGYGLIKVLDGKMSFMQLNELILKKYKDPYRQGLALLESGRAYLSSGGVNSNTQLDWQVKATATLDEAYRIFETLGATHHQYLTQATLKQLQSDDSIE